MKKVLVLNSGGLDSAIMCKKLHDEGFDVVSLYVDTNTISRTQTMAAAQETADRYCSEHIVQPISYGEHSDYLCKGAEHWTYDEAVANGKWQEYLDAQGVGFIFGPICSHTWSYLSQVVYHAFKRGITEVAIGYDKATYPETDRAKLETINPNGSWNIPVPEITFPLYDFNNYQEELDAINASYDDFLYTHSCRQETPCGWCDKCLKRGEL
jgi:7-cyano-7-deazaguanine synthase in queuosine biosynthesis